MAEYYRDIESISPMFALHLGPLLCFETTNLVSLKELWAIGKSANCSQLVSWSLWRTRLSITHHTWWRWDTVSLHEGKKTNIVDSRGTLSRIGTKVNMAKHGLSVADQSNDAADKILKRWSKRSPQPQQFEHALLYPHSSLPRERKICPEVRKTILEIIFHFSSRAKIGAFLRNKRSRHLPS